MRAFCLFFIFLLLSANVSADIYQTTQSDGAVLFSNKPATGSRLIMVEKKSKRKSAAGMEKNSARKSLVVLKRSRHAGNYSNIVEEKSKKHNVDPKLVKAVIAAESGWNPSAVSPKGAVGIMQLMPRTASDMGVDNRYNPEQNIEGGVKYLRFLLNKFNGNMTLALAAYNAGPTRVERAMGVPAIPETVNYVKRVMNTYAGGSMDYSWMPAAAATRIKVVNQEDGSVLFTNVFRR
jgi:soluble lytic murein transglycosylase-like protein